MFVTLRDVLIAEIDAPPPAVMQSLKSEPNMLMVCSEPIGPTECKEPPILLTCSVENSEDTTFTIDALFSCKTGSSELILENSELEIKMLVLFMTNCPQLRGLTEVQLEKFVLSKARFVVIANTAPPPPAVKHCTKVESCIESVD